MASALDTRPTTIDVRGALELLCFNKWLRSVSRTAGLLLRLAVSFDASTSKEEEAFTAALQNGPRVLRLAGVFTRALDTAFWPANVVPA